MFNRIGVSRILGSLLGVGFRVAVLEVRGHGSRVRIRVYGLGLG